MKFENKNGILSLYFEGSINSDNASVVEKEIDEMLKVYEDVDKIMKAKTVEIQNKLRWKLIED